MSNRRGPILFIAGFSAILFVVLLAYSCGRNDTASGAAIYPLPASEQAGAGRVSMTLPRTRLRSRRQLARDVIRGTFGRHADIAIRVAWCESRLSIWAWSGSDAGLFQANYSAHHHSGETVREFRRRHAQIGYHVRWAYRLSRAGTNWTHWRWSQGCWG